MLSAHRTKTDIYGNIWQSFARKSCFQNSLAVLFVAGKAQNDFGSLYLRVHFFFKKSVLMVW